MPKLDENGMIIRASAPVDNTHYNMSPEEYDEMIADIDNRKHELLSETEILKEQAEIASCVVPADAVNMFKHVTTDVD